MDPTYRRPINYGSGTFLAIFVAIEKFILSNGQHIIVMDKLLNLSLNF
jgi:hypothetical protein